MFKKKWVATLGISALLVGGVLSGCSKDSGDKAIKVDGGKPVEVTLAGWGSSPEEAELLSQVLKDFEDTHPNIKVKHEVIADQYMDVVKTRLIGGEGPDVFYLDAVEAPALIETGVLEPLNKYVKDDFDLNDFEKPLIEAFQKDGTYYGFPKGYSTLALFYNKKMFADAGVKVPTTWDELREVSKKLTDGTNVYGFGQNPELARAYFIAEAYGGKVVVDNKANFADQKVLDALQPYVDQHLVEKTAAQPSDVGTGWTGEMFGQGKAAMVIEGNWAIPYLDSTFPDIDYGMAEVPTIKGKKGTMAFTVAYVMNAASEKKEAAWELMSYLTGKEGMETWTSKGFELPSRKSVAEKLGYDKDELRGALVAGAPYATVWSNGTNLPIIFNNFNNQFVSVYLGQSKLADALKEAQETANKEIDKQ
ncbi:ABC transporter substrate-binding protein [Psychrobacillus sp. L4]|uniref:ABC transporter substrate-binding protein n=1 Tax=Psychrobacillus sp. L4 TaxID=3236892 RepID=UPI0036F19566